MTTYKYNKLIKNSLLISMGNIGSRIITFVMIPLYTYMLSTSEYGFIDLVITTVGLMLPLVSLNMFDGIFRFCMDKTYNKKEILNTTLIISLLGFAISILFFPLLDKIFDFKQYLIYFYCILFVQIMQGLFKQFIRAQEKMKVYVISDLVNTIIFVVLNIIFIVYFKLGIKGYFISLISAFIIDSLVLFILGEIYKYIDFSNISLKTSKVIILFCLPLIPNALMWWIVNLSDKYLISYYLGYDANGLYSIATKIPTIITTFYLIFSKAWQISVLDEYEDENFGEFYHKVFNKLAIFMILLSSILIIVNKYIVTFIVAEGFIESWRYVPFLIIGAIFSSFSNFYGVIYIANKDTRSAMYSTILAAIINILLNLLFIKLYGIQAACVSTAISFFIMWWIRVVHTKKILNTNLSKKLIISILVLVVQSIFSISNTDYIALNILLFGILIIVVKDELKLKNKI